MIQVLKRASVVLDLLAEGQVRTLKELAALTGLKKPTLYVILKSLVELGYVAKGADSRYQLGGKLLALTYSRRKEDVRKTLAGEVARRLSEDVRESVVVAKVLNGERYTVATATSRHNSLMVDTTILEATSFYRNATGRVLLAYLGAPELKEIIGRAGLPGDEWEEVGSHGELRKCLKFIRDEGMAFKLTADGQVQFVAVPVFGPDGKVWASIGVSLPASRFKGRHRTEVVEGLRSAGERMSRELVLSMA